MLTPDSDETRTAVVTLRPDGILVVRIKAGIVQFVADAEQNLAAAHRHAAGIPRPTLFDSRAVAQLDRTVRAVYVTSPLLTQTSRAMAVLIDSPANKIIANLFITLTRTQLPTRTFTAEDVALQWLQQRHQP